MKKPIAVKLVFDMKTVRRAVAIITGDVMSDEDLQAKFFDCEKVDFDMEAKIDEGIELTMCLAMVALIMQEPDASPIKPNKSKFQSKLEEMAEKRGTFQFENGSSISSDDKGHGTAG